MFIKNRSFVLQKSEGGRHRDRESILLELESLTVANCARKLRDK